MAVPAPVPLADPTDGMERLAFERLVQDSRQKVREGLNRVLAALPEEGPLVLEFGCGHGHFLVEYAQRHPTHRCLGIDYCSDRIRRAERKQSRSGLANVRFLRAAAKEVIAELPAEERCEAIFVLFPDPWPKRRHRKNRLVSAPFLDALAGICAPRAWFYFRSDAEDYAEDVKAALENHARWRLATAGSLPLEVETVFQQKASAFATLVAQLS